MRRKSWCLRPVAWALIFTFSYTQILYAADVRQMLLDAKRSFEEEDHRRGAADLEGAQDSHESLVDEQNTLHALSESNTVSDPTSNTGFSLTTQNGDILKYVGDRLSQVQRPDGTFLNNITLDENGSILDADLRLSDGSIQVFQDGQVLGTTNPDGTQVEYDLETGRVKKTTSREGVVTDYSYTLDVEGNVIETILETDKVKSTYDAQGKVKSTFSKADESTTYFDNGLFQKVIQKDGSVLNFTNTPLEDDLKITFDHLTDPKEEELINTLSLLNADLQNYQDEYNLQEAALAQQQAEADTLNNQEVSVQNNLTAAQDDLADTIQTSTDNINAKEAQVAELILDAEAADTAYQNALNEVGDLKQSIAASETHLAELQANLTEVDEDLTDAVSKLAAAKAALDKTLEDKAALEAERSQTAQSLSEEDAQAIVLADTQVQIENDILAYQEGADELAITESSLDAQIRQSESDLSAKEVTRGDLLSQIQVLNDQIVSLSALTTQRESELQSTTQDLSAIQTSITQAQSAIQDLDTLKTSLDQQLATVNAAIQNLEIALAAGKSRVFNGTSNYQLLGNLAGTQSKTNFFTLSAWIQPSGTVKAMQIFSKKTSLTSGFGYHFGLNAQGKLEASFAGAGGGSVTVTGTRNLFDAKLHQVALVRNVNTVFIYIDGVLEAQKTATKTIGDASNTVSAVIGRIASTRYFKGTIGDVRLYNQKAFSLQELQVLSTGQKPVAAPATQSIFSLSPASPGTINLSSLMLQKDSLNSQIASTISQRASQASALTSLESQRQTLQTTQTSLQALIQTSQGSLETAQNTLVTKNASLEALDQAISSLRSEIAQTRFDHTKVRMDLAAVQQKIFDANALLDKTKNDRTALEVLRTQHTNTLALQDAQIENLIQIQAQNETDVQLAQLLKNNLDLKKQDLILTISTEETSLNVLKDNLPVKEAQEQDLFVIQQASAVALSQAQTDLSDLRTRSALELQTKQATVDALSSELNSLIAEGQTLAQEITDLMTAMTAQEALIHNKRAQIDSKTAELSDHQEIQAEALSNRLTKLNFEYLLYRANRSLKEVLTKDGYKLSFDNNGSLQKATDLEGHETTFDFSQSSLLNLTGSTIIQTGVSSQYSAEGKLSSVKLDDMTIHYKDGSIDFIEQEDGTELHDLVFEGNDIKGTHIYLTSGEERIYEGGNLKEVRQPDETKLIFEYDAEDDENVLKRLL